MKNLPLFILFLLFACSSNNISILSKLKEQNLILECQKIKPNSYSVLASEQYECPISNLPEKKCSILLFDQEKRYHSTVQGFASVTKFIGPFQFKNEKKLTFVWCEKEMPPLNGEKISQIVENL